MHKIALMVHVTCHTHARYFSSLVDVVAHEIAHSWTGNLVTNKSWADFWLNEARIIMISPPGIIFLSQGFTVFLERKITGRMHGEQTRQFSGLRSC